MPFNGVGVFTRVYQWVQDAANGIFVDATRTDTDSNDIAAGLTNCVTRDGQSPWLANIPAGGFKITGLANGINATDSVNYAQVFSSPSFTGTANFINLTVSGTALVPTVSPGDNSLNAASTAFVNNVAFNAALPAQPGGTGRYVPVSIASSVSWLLDQSLGRRAITSASTVTIADAGNIVEFTSGTFTLSFSPVATLGDKASGLLYNSSTTGEVTLDPNGSETIDGLTSFVMYPGELRRWFVQGSSLRTLVLKNFYMVKSVSGNYIHPPGYSAIDLDGVGASGGGGSGSRGAAGTARSGGAPGGAPARVLRRIYGLTSGSTTAYTIGAAGVGGAAQTVDATNGIAGTAGGNTTFGATYTAFGGSGGAGGGIGGACSTTSGSGSSGAGGSGTGGQLGGRPSFAELIGSNSNAASASANNVFEGGGASPGNAGNTGGNSQYGGAGSAFPSISATNVINAGSSLYGVAAGGYGGWITTGNAVSATAGAAGSRGSWTAGGGPAGGNNGASPTAGTNGSAAANDGQVGESAGGGGSSTTVAGANGGDGGFPGGAPGGGGASANGSNSGAGGQGAGGRLIISGVV